MRRILFVVPGIGFTLHSFSAFMLVACFGALWITHWRARREKLDPEAVTELAIWLMTGGFIGARVLFVVRHPETIHSMWDLFRIWQGGIVFYGCIIGGL